MKQKMTMYSRGLCRILASTMGWRLVVGLFVIEALWFVFSAQYPMAFDENYHFGLIQLHAKQWLPFFTSQPPNSSAYGAVARDPSYLYHWLMSFPYRILGIFTDSQTAQVIWLRLLNVAMVVYALTLYRRIVARMGVSTALSNALFAVFILVPVVPFLAATINYDNMFMIAVAASLLLTFKVLDDLAEHRVNAGALMSLLVTLCLGSLIKFPFLPVFATTAGYVSWRLLRERLLNGRGVRSFMRSFLRLSYLRQLLLVLLCVVSIGLFVERYGENIVEYHNPVPACNAVLSEDECIQYGPYGRDAVYKQLKPTTFHPNFLYYIWQWLYGMWYRLFFAINYDYATKPPLLIISGLGVIGALAILVGVFIRFKALFARSPIRQVVLLVTLGYLAALLLDGYQGYVRTGQPVAINGRYLIGFMPLLFALGGLAWMQILQSRKQTRRNTAAIILTILLLQGGGVMTFIVRSDNNWMWSNSIVRTANDVVRKVASPIVLGKNIW